MRQGHMSLLKHQLCAPSQPFPFGAMLSLSVMGVALSLRSLNPSDAWAREVWRPG